MDDLRWDKDESSSLMLSNVWLSMPSSGRSGPEAPSALLSEGQRPPSSAARRFARSGMYALAASFLLRLPTVRLYRKGRRTTTGMKRDYPTKSLSLSTPGTRPWAPMIPLDPYHSPEEAPEEKPPAGEWQSPDSNLGVSSSKTVFLMLRSSVWPESRSTILVLPAAVQCRGPAYSA